MKIGDEVYNKNAPHLGTFRVKSIDCGSALKFVTGIGKNGMIRFCAYDECKLVDENHFESMWAITHGYD